MAKLTTKKRNALPKKSFVFPGTRKFPINDRAHARNALARAGAKGGSVEAKVKTAVHAKFPSIGQASKTGAKGASHAHHIAAAQHHAKMAQYHTAQMAKHTAAAHKAVGGNPGAIIQLGKEAAA